MTNKNTEPNDPVFPEQNKITLKQRHSANKTFLIPADSTNRPTKENEQQQSANRANPEPRDFDRASSGFVEFRHLNRIGTWNCFCNVNEHRVRRTFRFNVNWKPVVDPDRVV